MDEAALIDRLRLLATHEAACELRDDVAVLSPPLGRDLVLTHDMMVEGVHYLPDDAAGDVAWKLLAVNLSDLASKGAVPVGALLGFTLGDDQWDRDFIDGLGRALAHFGTALLGGDTVSPGRRGAPRVLGLTAIGHVPASGVPKRTGARAGDDLWVTGTIGDAGVGLAIARSGVGSTGADPAAERRLARRYRLPMPRLKAGQALAPLASAMMDISDGLLVDAQRMAVASGVQTCIDLALVPLSDALVAVASNDVAARLAAATAGDDYELLFAAAPGNADAVRQIALKLRMSIQCIGKITDGAGIRLMNGADELPLPDHVGWQHRPEA